jgi:hypothetical protein
MIIADTTIQHTTAVFLNVYDLHSDYRSMNCLLNFHSTDKIDDLLQHNCNHFTNIVLNRLFDIHLPLRFNRTLNCIFGNGWTRPMIRI